MKIRHLILVAGTVSACATAPVIVERIAHREEQRNLAPRMAACAHNGAPGCFTTSDAAMFPNLCRQEGGRLICQTAQTTWFDEQPHKRHLRITEMVIPPEDAAYCRLSIDAYTSDPEGGLVEVFAARKNPQTRRKEFSTIVRVIDNGTIVPDRGSASGVFAGPATSWFEQNVILSAYRLVENQNGDTVFLAKDALFDLVCGDRTR